MKKKHFFVKLTPPRPTFITDISDEEQKIMKQHGIYWSTFIENGTAIVIGPVMDPKGGFGMAVVEVDSEEELNEIISHDPANGLNRVEVFPMRAVYKQKN